MNKTLLAIALFGLAAGETSAQQIGRVARVEPVRYEKRDGRLKILSYVKLSEAPARKTVLQLGDEPLAVEAGSTGDSLLVWLPMIGKSDVLTLRSGRKVLSSKAVEAPIPDDWGYFRNGTIHIIQSSHQDIAWMDSPYNCIEARDRLIVSPALDLLARHPDYRYDIEDALILEEYLERHPDRRSEIGGYIASGRLGIGASYTQPYEEVQSGEALVRQFYFGKRWVEREFPGARQRTYWNVDVPGRTLQMPQILKKCGVDHLMYSRHQLGIYDWFAPDGSSVRVYTCLLYTSDAADE